MANISVAYQGIPGSFSYLAMREFFAGDPQSAGKKNFREIFQSVASGATTHAIIPVENTLAGSIYETYDLLWEFDLTVVGERSHRISHNLVAHAADEGDLKKIYSHPKAFEQCTGFFEKNPHLEKSAYSDTAGAAKLVAESKDSSLGAISSREAAELYGLNILRPSIEDNAFNFTRFLVLSKSDAEQSAADKCSVIFTLPHTPQSLYRTIEALSDDRINISKIESRPIHGKPFEYVFYIDFEFQASDLEFAKERLEAFKKRTSAVKVLGFYKKS